MRTFTDQHCQAGIWSKSVSRRTLAPGEQGRNNNNSSNTLSVETNGESGIPWNIPRMGRDEPGTSLYTW